MTRAIFDRITETLFPPVCPSCRSEVATQGTLSAACWRETTFLTDPACRRCGHPVPDGPEEELICERCLAHPPRWRYGAAATAYGGTARRLVLGLKHGDRLDTVPMLAGWMARRGGALLAEADLITPVPLHWTRLVRRRYNQSAELARRLAADAPGRFSPHLLTRTRRTPSQEGRSADERIANLDGAIRAAPAAAGRRVLLVDDVLTTGATLNAAADALYAAGARSVDILVLALVMLDQGPYFGAAAEERADVER